MSSINLLRTQNSPVLLVTYLAGFRTSSSVGTGGRAAGRSNAGKHHGVIKEVTDGVELRERAVEQHLEARRAGKTSLMISPRHEEARKVAAVVRHQLSLKVR